MLPVSWTEDKYPVILPAGESVPLIVRHPGVKRSDNVTFGNFNIRDDFDSPVLGDAWLTMRGPAEGLYSLTDKPGYLELVCSEEKATGRHTPAFVGRRLHHHKFSAQTRVYFSPTKHSDAAGLMLFKDERHQYFLKVTKDRVAFDKVEFEIVVESGKAPRMEQMQAEQASARLRKYRFVDLKITSDGETFSFWYAPNGGKWKALAEGVDASFLTSASASGFTGTLIGPYAVK